MPNGGDIIIGGGSVNLEYDESLYPRDPGDPRRHGNANRKITRVLVVDENGATKVDSNEVQSGLKWTVTVYTK